MYHVMAFNFPTSLARCDTQIELRLRAEPLVNPLCMRRAVPMPEAAVGHARVRARLLPLVHQRVLLPAKHVSPVRQANAIV